jgi:hypothetical protein
MTGNCVWCNLLVHAVTLPNGVLILAEDEAGSREHICATGDLTKEMVRLRSDEARLDWFASKGYVTGSLECWGIYGDEARTTDAYESLRQPHRLREVIDNAMSSVADRGSTE